MKNVIKMILVSSLLVMRALAAPSAEEAYVASYAGRTADMPVPVSVVRPLIEAGYEGREVRLCFVIGADGSPQEITAPAETDPWLVRQLTGAVAQWKFKPLVRDGSVVKTRVVLPIRIVEGAEVAPVAQL